jgi:predicted DNA-binding transcriptional regulator AlpA
MPWGLDSSHSRHYFGGTAEPIGLPLRAWGFPLEPLAPSRTDRGNTEQDTNDKSNFGFVRVVNRGPSSPDKDHPTVYLPAAAVLKRLNISDQQLWRLTRDPKYAHLGFPQPVRFGVGKNPRRYFSQADLEAWLASRPTTNHPKRATA